MSDPTKGKEVCFSDADVGFPMDTPKCSLAAEEPALIA